MAGSKVLRANHHGSAHSSNQSYINTLDPNVSLISCGANSYGHPAQTTLGRLLATSAVYLTNLCDTKRNYGSVIIANGDVVIQSSDGVYYSVNGAGFVTTSHCKETYTIKAHHPHCSASH